jgi:hypothetical protein
MRMIRTSLRPYLVMSSLIALALAITSALGLANPAIYRPFMGDALWVGMPVQDTVSLLVACGLVTALVYARRGSIRALVIWAGLLVYAAYYYAFLCFDPVYTVVYPLYLAIMGLAVYSLAGLLSSVDTARFAAQVDAHMPVRGIAVVLGMALLFIPIWGSKIAAGIAARQVEEAHLVFTIDLAFMIPAMTVAAVQVWRRQPVGYLFSGGLLVKAALSGILLTSGSLRQMVMGVAVPWPELAMYLFLAVPGLVGLAFYLRHLHEPRPGAARANPLRPRSSVGR